jgi:hypothetical protein
MRYGKLAAALILATCVQTSFVPSSQAGEQSSREIRKVGSDGYIAVLDPQAETRANGIDLVHGTMFLACKKDASVEVNDVKLHLKRGAVVLIKADDGIMTVRNLNDKHYGSVRVHTTRNHWIHLGVAQEAMIGRPEAIQTKLDNIGRRAIKLSDIPERGCLRIADINLQDNLVNEPVLVYARCHADSTYEHRIIDDLIKTTAVCNLVTRSKGPYFRGVF